MTENDARIASFFDHCADEGVMVDFTDDERAAVDAALSSWGISPGQRVCEPGCGAGRLTAYLAEAVGPAGEVLAIDLSAAMLERALARGLPGQVRLHLGSVESVEAPDGYFHHVVCFHAFPHFGDRVRAVAEIARVLAPGGQLAVCHLMSRQQVNAHHAEVGGVVGDHRIPDGTAMRRLLAWHELEVTSIRDGVSGYALLARKRPAATALS